MILYVIEIYKFKQFVLYKVIFLVNNDNRQVNITEGYSYRFIKYKLIVSKLSYYHY